MTINTLKAQLEAKREELRAELQHLAEIYPSSLPGRESFESQDWGEVVVALNEAEDEKALRSNREMLLREVEAALARIERGIYGICIDCHQPIPEKRLQILPWVARDVHCQEQFEAYHRDVVADLKATEDV